MRLSTPACPLNTFKNVTGEGECYQCPPNSYTATTASNSVDDCLCNPGYYGSGELGCSRTLAATIHTRPKKG